MQTMAESEIMNEIMELVNGSNTAVVSSVDENGYPNAKQMFKVKHDGIRTFWFSTNTSSMRVQQFRNNAKASIYFTGHMNGLMLLGNMEICTDWESREMLWSDGCEVYYPLGVDDPDYCVLKFTAETGNYYKDLVKHLFSVGEFDGVRSKKVVMEH
jgi:general stress protein 26